MSLLKKIIKSLPFDFTLNQKYDTQTLQVIRRHCKATSCCIDIGCHKGEIMDLFLKYAPEGRHLGFEPIPDLCKGLEQKYAGTPNCVIHNLALSNVKGTSSFNYVLTNPAYSGLIKRKYDRPNEKDVRIEVATERLDAVLTAEQQVDLIKIDVEGGELLVLEGAVNTLRTKRPLVIFEHGLGASDCYGTKPGQVFELFRNCGYNVTTMQNWLRNAKPFTLEQFEQQFYKQINYYFLAFPDQD